jgi:hypothetical protein
MVTLNDIGLDADLFRRHAPHWPHPEPERGTDVITVQELDRMPRTEGTCTVCGKDTLVYALGEFTCRKCALKPKES